jgi:hypothetical protein
MPAPTAPVAPPPGAETPDPEARPGRFRLGPFYLNPYVRIHNIGVDTNVLYTATERQTDLSASGGPGLELILPMGRTSRFYVRGDASYLFFARTESQRRWNYSAGTGLELRGAKTAILADYIRGRIFSRPNFEVDERVIQDIAASHLELQRSLFWRLGLNLSGSRTHTDVEDVDYLGTNLNETLSRVEYRARAGLAYAVTVKTSIVGEVEWEWDRFDEDDLRDADSIEILGGLRTDATALVAGHALVGRKRYTPVFFPESEQELTVVDVDAMLNVSPRTKFGVSYVRDLEYSAFAPSDAPTLRTETYGARFDKVLSSRVDLRLFARRTLYKSDAPITVVLPDGVPVSAVRDDKFWEFGVDLGYRFRPKFRMGAVVSYSERDSTTDYFGVDGLLVGMSVNFTP